MNKPFVYTASWLLFPISETKQALELRESIAREVPCRVVNCGTHYAICFQSANACYRVTVNATETANMFGYLQLNRARRSEVFAVKGK